MPLHKQFRNINVLCTVCNKIELENVTLTGSCPYARIINIPLGEN